MSDNGAEAAVNSMVTVDIDGRQSEIGKGWQSGRLRKGQDRASDERRGRPGVLGP